MLHSLTLFSLLFFSRYYMYILYIFLYIVFVGTLASSVVPDVMRDLIPLHTVNAPSVCSFYTVHDVSSTFWSITHLYLTNVKSMAVVDTICEVMQDTFPVRIGLYSSSYLPTLITTDSHLHPIIWFLKIWAEGFLISYSWNYSLSSTHLSSILKWVDLHALFTHAKTIRGEVRVEYPLSYTVLYRLYYHCAII